MACMGSYCSIINFAPVCFCSKIEVHTDFPKMSTKRTIVRRPVAEQALLLLFLVLSSMEVTKKGSGVGFAFAFFAGAPTSSTIIRQQRIFLHMTPPTRPGEMPRDETPMDSTNYFQSRGVTVDLEANKPNPLEVQTNVYKHTDVGDFYPEGYVDEIESVIPRCLQNSAPRMNGGMTVADLEKLQQAGFAAGGGGGVSPANLPGQEYMTEEYWENDVVQRTLAEGLEECNPYIQNCIPEGMEFIPNSVPDAVYSDNVALTGSGESFTLQVEPYCMGYEDYFAGFTVDSHPAWSVTPNAGRMDRRGGEPTVLQVTCDPRGHAVPDSGCFDAVLVINVPEDESKLTYYLRGIATYG